MSDIATIQKMIDDLAEKKLRELLLDLKKQADEKRKQMRTDKLEKILIHLKKNTVITNRTVRKITDVSEMTAVYYLRDLVKEKKLKRIDKGRNVAYVLK